MVHLRPRSQALGLLILAIIVFGCVFGIHRYRYRFVESSGDLAGWAAQEGATRFFADVDVLREAGLLAVLAGPVRQSEAEYQRFVDETGFDYSRDLHALAGSYRDGNLLLALQGRWNWDRLRQYAVSHGGKCPGNICTEPASEPGRWISWRELQPNVLVVRVSNTKGLTLGGKSTVQSTPQAPVWLEPARSLWKDPAPLPLPIRMLATALQSSENVVISGARAHDPKQAFTLRLEASFPASAQAEAARAQFQTATRLIAAELAREHAPADGASIAGLLTGGTFFVTGNDLIGEWPVSRELIETLH